MPYHRRSRSRSGTSDRPNITNYIEVKVYSGNDDDETLANKVAARIVEVIENM